MDMLDEDEGMQAQVEDIFITPPEVNAESDEDSADDDEGGMVYNLTVNSYLKKKSLINSLFLI